MSTGYVISSLVWITVGFVVGYLVGSHLNGGEDVVTSDDATRARRGWKLWLRRNLLGVLALLVVAASTALYAQQAATLSRVTECQRTYNQAFAAGLAARSEAARMERQSQRELLTAILSRPGDRESGRAALDRYLRGLDQADRDRASAPLPTNTCGDFP